MENVFSELTQACKDAGTNLTTVCKAAGIHRSVPQRWKENDPKTVAIYRLLISNIAKIKASKNPEDDAC